MTTEEIVRIVTDRLLQQGLRGAKRIDVLTGYCVLLKDLGVPLLRMHVAQRTLHPEVGGFGFVWWREGSVKEESYPLAMPNQQWLVSPLFHMLVKRQFSYRERLLEGPSRFTFLNELRDLGATDYFARTLPFEDVDKSQPIDPMHPPQGAQVTWVTDEPDGFTDEHLSILDQTLPALGVVLKSAAHRRLAVDLLGYYLGRDAGGRVLSGEIQRGSLQTINAAICCFDLVGFTGLAERTHGQAVIEMLNAYFGLTVNVIEQSGGHVLKFMGDGLLAMFDVGDMRKDAEAALETARRLSDGVAGLNAARRAQGLPVTGFTLALHNGEILYGNIGGEQRLDFTVIGPAVNLTARVSDMHKAVGRDILVTEAIRDALDEDREDLVSVGRYMLRGVSAPMELFTIYQTEETA